MDLDTPGLTFPAWMQIIWFNPFIMDMDTPGLILPAWIWMDTLGLILSLWIQILLG